MKFSSKSKIKLLNQVQCDRTNAEIKFLKQVQHDISNVRTGSLNTAIDLHVVYQEIKEHVQALSYHTKGDDK